MTAVTAVVACALMFGCSKDKPKEASPEPARPTPISVEERTRNAEACKAYVDQVCACAKAHPDKPVVAERCQYDQSLPAALELAIATAMNPASTRNDVLLSQDQARKIGISCLDQLAALPSLGCP
jgi:hypothetical protein